MLRGLGDITETYCTEILTLTIGIHEYDAYRYIVSCVEQGFLSSRSRLGTKMSHACLPCRARFVRVVKDVRRTAESVLPHICQPASVQIEPTS